MSLDRLCAGCNGIVYPVEQLKCLDQIWHRACFKCVVCKMPLNMYNYQGYDRRPYCKAHYPQPNKFTVIADTPEMQRAAANTRVISNAAYHHQSDKKATMEEMRKKQQSATDRAKLSQSRDELYHHYEEPLSVLNNNNNNNNVIISSNQPQPQHQQQLPGIKISQTGSAIGVNNATTNSCMSNVNNNNNNNNINNNNGSNSTKSTANTTPSNATNSGNNILMSAPPGTVFRALYSYEAKESDEVTFTEGDLIIEGDPIDRGWMYGRVQRSGQWGMLPSNYVQPVN